MSTIDPIQGLIDYVNEIKPFHSKILEVAVAYSQNEDVDISISEALEMVISLFYPSNADDDNVPLRNCPEGWGVEWDRPTPYIVIDASLSPQTVSLSGDQSEFFDVGTRFEIREPTSPVGSPLVGSPSGTPAIPAVPGVEVSHILFSLPNFDSSNEPQARLGDSTFKDFDHATLELSTVATAGEQWLVFLGVGHGRTVSTSSVNTFVRVVEDLATGSPTTVTALDFSTTAKEAHGVTAGFPYGFMRSITSTGNNLKFQASTAATANVTLYYPSGFGINLDELGSNASYFEDTTGLTNFTGDIWTDTAATITIGNSSDDYLVFWSIQFNVDGAGTNVETGLRFGTGSPETIRLLSSMETENNAEVFNFAGHTFLQSPSNQSFTIAARQVGVSTNDVLFAAICAIRLDAFEDHFGTYFDESLANSFLSGELLAREEHVTSTSGSVDWAFFNSARIKGVGTGTVSGFSLQVGQTLGSPKPDVTPVGSGILGSPNLRENVGYQPITDPEGGNDDIAGSAIGEVASVADGTELEVILLGHQGTGFSTDESKSLVGFTWNFPGTPEIPAVPGITLSEPATAQFYKYQALSVDYDNDTNRTVIGARELRSGFLGSPVLFGSPTPGSPFLEGSPPLSGNEFFFPPYPAGSISNGDVFICYDVVATNKLVIFTRPNAFYGSPNFTNPPGSPFGSPLGSPLFNFPGSPGVYPNFGSPNTAGNTVIIKAISTAPFIYGREVQIRNAAELTINKTYNILRAIDLEGSPQLIELTMLDPILTDTTFDGELVFTPNGWSGGSYCSDVPPEFFQTHWMEQLDQTWRFVSESLWTDATFIQRHIGTPQVANRTSPGFQGGGARLSSDGSRAVIGYKGITALAGRVNVLDRVGDTYTQFVEIAQPAGGANNDEFGNQLDINSDGTIIVVASTNQTSAQGSVYIFELASGSPFTTTQQLVSPIPSANDVFGSSVAISDNGTTIVVGARADDNPNLDVGNVYVYEKQGSPFVWTLVSTLTNPDIDKPGSPALSGSFGQSVDIDTTGNRILVGAPNNGAGTPEGNAFVYTRSAVGSPISFVLEYEFNFSGSPIGESQIGGLVSLNSNGTVAALGANRETVGALSESGVVYVFARGTGSPVVWTLEKKVSPDTPTSNAAFGGSIDLSNNGEYLTVGAKEEDTPSAAAGAAYVFKRNGGSWDQQIRISGAVGSPSSGAAGKFGSVVNFSGDTQTLIIGVSDYTGTSALTGATDIYDTVTIIGPLADAYQHFILAADSTANTLTVEGDVRNILTDFGANAEIQHSVTPPYSQFGSPVNLNANNGTVVISSITYNVTTNRSTIFVDTVTDDFPSGWIVNA